jgi:hypothetical protein
MVAVGSVAAASAETVSHPPGSWRVLGEFARTLSLGTRTIPDGGREPDALGRCGEQGVEALE